MNSIGQLSAQYAGAIKNTAGLQTSEADAGGKGFADILSDALNMTQSTETQSEASSLQLLSGQADDIASVLINAKKAETALSLTIQLRNKLMDSYDAVMNMQI